MQEAYGPDFIPEYTIENNSEYDPNSGLSYEDIFGMADYALMQFVEEYLDNTTSAVDSDAFFANGGYCGYFDMPTVTYDPSSGEYRLSVWIEFDDPKTGYYTSGEFLSIWTAEPNEAGGTDYWLHEWSISQ